MIASLVFGVTLATALIAASIAAIPGSGEKRRGR